MSEVEPSPPELCTIADSPIATQGSLQFLRRSGLGYPSGIRHPELEVESATPDQSLRPMCRS
jgi:hypothetical protein